MRSTPVKSVQSLVSLLSLAPLLSPPPSEAQSRHCLLPWRADCDVTPHPAPLPSLLLPSLTPHWHSLSWPALSLAPLLIPPPSEAQSRHCLLPWRGRLWCHAPPPAPLFSLLLPSLSPHRCSLSWPVLSACQCTGSLPQTSSSPCFLQPCWW